MAESATHVLALQMTTSRAITIWTENCLAAFQEFSGLMPVLAAPRIRMKNILLLVVMDSPAGKPSAAELPGKEYMLGYRIYRNTVLYDAAETLRKNKPIFSGLNHTA